MSAAPKYLNCPADGCVYKFRVSDVLIDQYVTCPQCGFSFHLPDPDNAAAMAEYEKIVAAGTAEDQSVRASAQQEAAAGLDLQPVHPHAPTPPSDRPDDQSDASARAKATELRKLDKLPQRIERAKFIIEATEHGNRIVVVTVTGTVDPHEAILLEAYLKACIQTYPSRLVIDLAGMKAAHSSGIGALVSAVDKGAAIECRLVFANVQPAVKFVLDTLGLSDVVESFGSVADALAAT